jgi:hypothetical protein
MFSVHSDVQTQTLVYLPAIELLSVDFPQISAELSAFLFLLFLGHPMFSAAEGRQ